MKDQKRRDAVELVGDEETLLTTVDVARITGLSVATLTKARYDERQDTPPYIKIGRNVRYRLSSVKKWVLELEERN